jgi:hypothetical protein
MWTALQTRPHSPTTTATTTGAHPHAGNAKNYRDQERQRTLAAGGALKTTLQTHPGLGVGQSLMAANWVKGSGERHPHNASLGEGVRNELSDVVWLCLYSQH